MPADSIVVNKQNPVYAQAAKRIWSLVRPMDAVGGQMARIGRRFDGGYVMVDHGFNGAVAYSLGISDDVSWDFDAVARGAEVFQYDHTINAAPDTHPKMHWSKIGVSHVVEHDKPLQTLEQMIQSNGHGKRNDLILKMDVEGAEWPVIERVSSNILAQFSQLVIEMHWFRNIDDTGHFRRFDRCLSKLNQSHQVVHVHGNNCGELIIAGGVPIPETLEVTYVRRSDWQFVPCTKVFPTELDEPNDYGRADWFLGALGML